jgi:hypothetical protein
MMSNEDVRKWFEDLFNKGTLVSTASLEQFSKQIEQFNTENYYKHHILMLLSKI